LSSGGQRKKLVSGTSEMLILSTLLCAVKAFDPSNRPRCLISGQAVEGWNQINSPQFPNPLPGKLECLYVLSAPKGAKIELHFDQFELMAKNNPSCKNQGLALLDPFQTNIPGVTEIFCGLQKPVPFVSRGNKIFLKLDSNIKASQGKFKGFMIKYRIAAKSSQKDDSEGPKSGPGSKSGPGPKTGSRPKTGPKPVMKNRNPMNRAGGKIMAVGGGASRPKFAKDSAAQAPRRPSNSELPNDQTSSDTNLTLADSNDVRRPQNGPQRPQNGPQRPQEAEIIYDMPIALKTAQLGSKSDLETKAMLKKMLIGFGAASCLIIVYLIFRRMTGKTNGGIPEPELKLPEGTLPSHLRAIQEHKDKMKSMGKEYPDDE